VDQYLLQVAFIACIYALLVLSLNLVVGYAGMFSMAHAVFYGLGAYASALVALHLGVPLIIGLVVGVVVGGAVAALVGFTIRGLREEYLAVATLGLQAIFTDVVQNAQSVTGGLQGLTGFPYLANQVAAAVSAMIALLLTFALTYLLSRRQWGRALRAIRDDEVVAEAVGVNTTALKIQVLALAGGIAALAGGLLAFGGGFIDPSSFSLRTSILILIGVILGGAGRLAGSLLGAAVLVLLPEVMRFIGLSGATVGQLQQVVFGAVLLFILLVRSRGILPERPGARLRDADAQSQTAPASG
jgi:branched-chain amino acid transport system permease protein